MKNINQLREASDILSETADAPDTKKLASLVRLGLFDSSKLTLLKRALAKDNTKMTRAEKDVLIDLLDRLLSVVTNDSAAYNRVKHEVMAEEIKSPWNKTDKNTDVDITKIPPIVIMKRRAIRVFPDGQKVALYWADRLDKYISVPFQSIGLSEAFMGPYSASERARDDAINSFTDDTPKAPPGSREYFPPGPKLKVKVQSKGASRVRAKAKVNSNVPPEVKQPNASQTTPEPAVEKPDPNKPKPRSDQDFLERTKSDHAAYKSAGIRGSRLAGAHVGGLIRNIAVAGVRWLNGDQPKKVSAMPTKPGAIREKFLSRVARPILTEADDEPIFGYRRPRPESQIKGTTPGKKATRAADNIDTYEGGGAPDQRVRGLNRRWAAAGANTPDPNRLPKAKREVSESIIAGLKEFVTSADDIQNITIKESSVAVSKPMAKKLVALHESMNKVNQAKMEKMLSEDSTSFYKLVNFALKTL